MKGGENVHTDTTLEERQRRVKRRPTRPLMTDEQFERAYAPDEYRHKQLAAKLDRIIELLSEGRE